MQNTPLKIMPSRNFRQLRLPALAVRTSTQIIPYLMGERPLSHLLWVAGLLSSLFVFTVFDVGYLIGNGAYWQNPPFDSSSHLSGLLYYLSDPWQFPIFNLSNVNLPAGSSIVFTDSIPSLALVAKVLHSIVGIRWNYLGLFMGLSYVANALSMTWLLWNLKAKNLLAPLFAFVFTCFVTLSYFQFESLNAHFLVILTLALYFRAAEGRGYKNLLAAITVSILALLIHPYLFFMTAGIVAALFLQLAKDKATKGVTWATLVAIFCTWGLLAWITAFVAGHLQYLATTSDSLAYGHRALSLNLAEPLINQVKQKDITLYLGWGTFALLGVALAGSRGKIGKLAKKYWPLFLVLFSYFLVAITNNVWFGDRLIVSYTLPPFLQTILNMVRSSRRFVVPIFYAFTALSFIRITRYNKEGTALIVIILVMQISSLSFFIEHLHQVTSAARPTHLSWPEWESRMQEVSHLNVYPSYSCLQDVDPIPFTNLIYLEISEEFFLLAARNKLPSNSLRVARRNKNCLLEKVEGQTSAWESAALQVYLKDEEGNFPINPPQAYADRLLPFEFGVYGTL